MGLHASKLSSVKEQDISVHKNSVLETWNAWKPIDIGLVSRLPIPFGFWLLVSGFKGVCAWEAESQEQQEYWCILHVMEERSGPFKIVYLYGIL